MMEKVSITRHSFSLYELNSAVKLALSEVFPDTCWVTAEIADSKCNQRGHCYLELVEKDGDSTIAQIKATIWAYDYRKLSHKFQNATGETLKPGMKVMLLVVVTFHEVYGLSLNVKDIDPTYTMGDMARKKKEVIERLIKEGLMDLNKGLPLPLVPQRIAVISSATAAGYGDFIGQIDNNLYGYRFSHVLFTALMQGPEAERSIISALNKIKRHKHLFDAVIMIRGGGSVIDLNCFDCYDLTANMARFPLPIITGIGHEKDDSVADMVAHTRMKTPTAVAEFLISGVRSFEEKIIECRNRLILHTDRFLKDERYRLNSVLQSLNLIPMRLSASESRLSVLQRDLVNSAGQFVRNEESRLKGMEQAVRLLDPVNLLRRGYSITRHRGKILKDASVVKSGDVLDTRLYNGNVISIAGNKKEGRGREQKQTDNLLPGFDGA